MDRVSDLPDELIRHIGSFLPAKETAFTNVLSKRWQNLITIESELAFDDSNHVSFELFVARLEKQCPSDRVRTFSLKLRSANLDPALYNLVNNCLRNVLKRGVMHLELDINVVNKDYTLPIELFTCSTLVNLKLGSGFVVDFIPEKASLSALKTLFLGSVQFYRLGDGCVFQRLISACPLLERLMIIGFNCELWNWSGTVSSKILKGLAIRRNVMVQQDGSSCAAISFDTPSLKYFEYCDLLRDEYPVVNLDSLVEAKLDLPVSHAPESYNVRNLIHGLKNVEILRLDHVETMQLFDAAEEAFPVFENLLHIVTSTKQNYCWHGLKLLVENAPKLKALTIEELHYRFEHGRNGKEVCKCLSGYTFLKSCPVKVLRITDFRGRIGEMVQLRLILRSLVCLELLEVHLWGMWEADEKARISSELVKLPELQPNAKFRSSSLELVLRMDFPY